MVFVQSHKTDDYAITCQVSSNLRCHTEHTDKLYVLCTGDQDSFDRLYKYTVKNIGKKINTVHGG